MNVPLVWENVFLGVCGVIEWRSPILHRIGSEQNYFPSGVNVVYVEHAMIGCSCTRFGKGIIEINALACHIYTKQGKLVSIGSKFPALKIGGFVFGIHIIMLAGKQNLVV